MVENTSIAWANHTFNPWIGCTKVSPACDNCYAEKWDQRFHNGIHWGPKFARKRTAPANWKKPLKWNREAADLPIRPKVFCASMADIFDNHRSILPEWRQDLWALIKATPNLDWLILTKRPQNFRKYLPDGWMRDGAWLNVWLGVTVENQEEAERRIPVLTATPARKRFLSCEPLLAELDLMQWFFPLAGSRPLHWIIAGGENDPNFREVKEEWLIWLSSQCAVADVPFFFKQWGGPNQRAIKALGHELNGRIQQSFPRSPS